MLSRIPALVPPFISIRRSLVSGALLATSLCSGVLAFAEDPIWSVGVENGSSDEFSQNIAGPSKAVRYVVGKSQPDRDWYSFQPAIIGGKAVAREIQFTLEGELAPAYQLRVALLVERAAVPAMQVTVNGKSGLFHLSPKLDNRMGDSTGGNRTGYSCDDLFVDIPGGWLKSGENTISLLPVIVSDEAVPDAGLNYDVITLSKKSATTDTAAINVNVEPTIFYTGTEKNLQQVINVKVRYFTRPQDGKVILELGGRRFEKPLAASREFGEEQIEFSVPEFSGEQKAKVTTSTGGKQIVHEQMIKPGKKWTVFVVPHIHLDVGYTDYQAKVGVLQARVLEQAMDLVAQHPEFRFSSDGAWNLENFMNTRSESEKARMVESMRKKEVFIPAQYCCMLTGFPTAETLIRSLYPSANFARTHGTPFDYANLTDVPSHTWSYPSVLASAGVKYFFAGSNSDRGPIVLVGRLNEASPYWWEGPDGKKVLMWYSRVYRQVQMLFGLPPQIGPGKEMLPVFLQMYSNPDYKSNAVILYGTQGENRELFPQQAELIKKWNARYTYPKLEYSGFRSAVEVIAGQFGDQIKTISGDGGPYWEDGIAANPLRAAIQRGNERRGITAEKLNTISALVNPRLQVNKSQIDRMWSNMVLYDEHTQVVSNSMPAHDTQKTTGQLEVKNLYADTANELAKELILTGAANLTDSVSTGRGSLVVYNSLNWVRDGMVTHDIGTGEDIVDAATGKVVPVEVVSRGVNFRRASFIAEQVPAMGYKVYYLKPSARRAAETADETTLTLEDVQDRERGGTVRNVKQVVQKDVSPVIESPFYRLEIDPATGSLRSLFDKELNRELVDQKSPYRFGQYVYVTGGDTKPNGILQYAKVKPELTVHTSEKGRLLSVTKVPYGWSAKLESTAIYTPRILTEIRVYEKEKKIEFIHDVRKNQVYRREGVYFAFPFAMSAPQFQYEIQNGVIDPTKNMLPGAGQEWFSVQNWVAVQQDGASAAVFPLDAPLLTLGDINRGEWPMTFGKRPGTVFSFVVNNYHQPRSVTDFGAELKNDDLRFRYVVTSAPSTDPVALSRRGWSEMTPMERSEVQPQDKSWVRRQPLDGKSGGFLKADDPSLVLTAWKTAEDGDGTILRFLDVGGDARTVTIEVPIVKLSSVQLTDAVERNQQALKIEGPHRFSFKIAKNEIVTVRLKGAPTYPPRDPKDRGNEGGLSSPFGSIQSEPSQKATMVAMP